MSDFTAKDKQYIKVCFLSLSYTSLIIYLLLFLYGAILYGNATTPTSFPTGFHPSAAQIEERTTTYANTVFQAKFFIIFSGIMISIFLSFAIRFFKSLQTDEQHKLFYANLTAIVLWSIFLGNQSVFVLLLISLGYFLYFFLFLFIIWLWFYPLFLSMKKYCKNYTDKIMMIMIGALVGFLYGLVLIPFSILVYHFFGPT